MLLDVLNDIALAHEVRLSHVGVATVEDQTRVDVFFVVWLLGEVRLGREVENALRARFPRHADTRLAILVAEILYGFDLVDEAG